MIDIFTHKYAVKPVFSVSFSVKECIIWAEFIIFPSLYVAQTSVSFYTTELCCISKTRVCRDAGQQRQVLSERISLG